MIALSRVASHRVVVAGLAMGLWFGVGCKKAPEQKPLDELAVATTEAPDAETLTEGNELPAVDQGGAMTDAPPKERAAASAESGIDSGLDRKIRAALKDAESGDLARAAESLAALVESPNGGYLAAYNLGLVHEAQGAYDKAAQDYYKALTLEPDFSPALMNLTRLYLRQGSVEDAKKIVEKSTSARPDNLGHRVAELEVMLEQRRYEDVERQARELLRRDEQNIEAMIALAEANYRLEKFELARAILERGVKIDPERGELFYRNGLVELKLGNKTKARTNFEEAVRVQPRLPEAHNNLGVLMHEARDYDNAIAHYRKAIGDWPDFAVAWLNLGNAYKGKGSFKEAETSFKKAIEVDANYADAHFNLALLYLESDMQGISVEQRLQLAIDTLNTYKSVARGKLEKGDPADKYIAEAKKAIEEEKARQEMLRQSQMGVDESGNGEEDVQ